MLQAAAGILVRVGRKGQMAIHRASKIVLSLNTQTSFGQLHGRYLREQVRLESVGLGYIRRV